MLNARFLLAGEPTGSELRRIDGEDLAISDIV
jgi:hypothetical protein